MNFQLRVFNDSPPAAPVPTDESSRVVDGRVSIPLRPADSSLKRAKSLTRRSTVVKGAIVRRAIDKFLRLFRRIVGSGQKSATRARTTESSEGTPYSEAFFP